MKDLASKFYPQKLASWIIKNWRVEGKVYDRQIRPIPKRYTSLHIVQEKYESAVTEKVRALIGESAEGRSMGIRAKAAGMVLADMTADEREKVKKEAKERCFKALPEAKQCEYVDPTTGPTTAVADHI